jgi:hypothetical protein
MDTRYFTSLSLLRFCLIGEQAVGSVAVVQQASRATDSARSWEVAKRWVEECTTSHPTCQRTIMPENMPTRLLGVGTNGHELHLCLSKDLPEDTKYLTLSHCWGSKRFLTVTRNNLESFFEKIPFEILSKTCRDAITSTRRWIFVISGLTRCASSKGITRIGSMKQQRWELSMQIQYSI